MSYKQTFEHDSYLGWLNNFKVIRMQPLYVAGERPPYPIIISEPTVGDVLKNLNKADFGQFAAFTIVGFFVSRRAVHRLTSTEYIRQRVFSIAWNTFMLFGGLFACMTSNNRLTGFADNGLSWRRKENKLRKYDFTTEFEESTLWKYFRLR